MRRDMRKRYSDCVQLLYDAFGGRFASGSRADTTCCDPGRERQRQAIGCAPWGLAQLGAWVGVVISWGQPSL